VVFSCNADLIRAQQSSEALAATPPMGWNSWNKVRLLPNSNSQLTQLLFGRWALGVGYANQRRQIHTLKYDPRWRN
jgi:hypothetical protein